MILYVEDPTSTEAVDESGAIYQRTEIDDGYGWQPTARRIAEWIPADYRAKAIRKARRER